MPLVAVLGATWSLGIISLAVMNYYGGRSINGRWLWFVFPSLGCLAGFLASGMSFLLMLFKNVQHSHLTPDFPNETLLGILARAPAWALAGGLFGLAFVFFLSLKDQADEVKT